MPIPSWLSLLVSVDFLEGTGHALSAVRVPGQFRLCWTLPLSVVWAVSLQTALCFVTRALFWMEVPFKLR